MATDGTLSFVIFLYADGLIQWTTGDASEGIDGLGGTPAQVGFNAGDSERYAAVPGSSTASIINIASTSNVDVDGVWIYRVDAAKIVDPSDESNISLMKQLCTFAFPTQSLFKLRQFMNFDYLIAEKWSRQNRTSRTGSVAPA